MLFNSLDFALFLPIVFILYWFVVNKNLRNQNILIVVASYFFYAWWDWRFLFLIIFSTLVDYLVGLRLAKQENNKKRLGLLWISILVNIGFLGFFKYYNFFIDNFVSAFSFFGKDIQPNTLSLILPVGISFYTFQTLSYTIDVYREKLKPTKDFFSFAAFISFFPQLVAGPIERATNLLPQFYKKRTFVYNKAGYVGLQILWGLFKKIVIADNSAQIANEIFNNSADYSGSTLLLGALFFSFQIYGDFSGYSDIAIGTARLFGFNLKQNFAYPYFSRDIAEFWRRWHISLSSWFRDYLYIPLGGSRNTKSKIIRNIFIIFIISGFWHGANWTFIVWGTLNALYYLPLLIFNKNRKHRDVIAQGKYLPSLNELFKVLVTFSLTVLAWIFFRAESVAHAWAFLTGIFTKSLFSVPEFQGRHTALVTAYLIVIFIIVEWIGRENKYAIEKLGTTWKRPLRWMLYLGIVMAIFFFMGKQHTFIYFQF